jgi:hypothetical protein
LPYAFGQRSQEEYAKRKNEKPSHPKRTAVEANDHSANKYPDARKQETPTTWPRFVVDVHEDRVGRIQTVSSVRVAGDHRSAIAADAVGLGPKLWYLYSTPAMPLATILSHNPLRLCDSAFPKWYRIECEFSVAVQSKRQR